MLIKKIIDEDFNDYGKKPSMFIAFPKCTFKCDKECGNQVCQNCELTKSQNIDITIDKLIDKYFMNGLTKAVVCGGLEPFDSWEDLSKFIGEFRKLSNDDIVIYTGYNKNELLDKIEYLKTYPNIIIKFGRFIPNQEKHFDEVLGVELASINQYAERIS